MLAVAPPETLRHASTGSPSALVVVDGRCGCPAQALSDVADVATARITVAGVPTRLGLIAHWAPLSGLITPQQLQADLLEEARRSAVTAAVALAGAPLVLGGWTAVTRLLREGGFDVAVLAAAPRSRRLRRTLVRASGAAGTALVMARRT